MPFAHLKKVAESSQNNTEIQEVPSLLPKPLARNYISNDIAKACLAGGKMKKEKKTPAQPTEALCITKEQIQARDAQIAIQLIEGRTLPAKSRIATVVADAVSCLPTDLTFMADFFSHDAYFWLSKIMEAAYATTTVQHALIINSIIIRYSNDIFTKSDPAFTSELRTTLITTFTDLVSKVGGFLTPRERKKAKNPTAEYTTEDYQKIFEKDWKEEGPDDEPVDGTFGSLVGSLSTLVKYMRAQGVYSDLLRLIAIGLLGSFTYVWGDREQFNLTNIEAMVKSAVRIGSEGTLGSLGRVLSSMYGIFRDYVAGQSEGDLSEFIRQNTQQDAFQLSIMELEIKRRSWGVLDVDAQGSAVEEWLKFELYCDKVLGRATGWTSGKRILAHNPKLLYAFQAAYHQLKIHFNDVNMGALRVAPWCFALIGPSSIGKSTIMDIIMNLILRSEGFDNINELLYNLLGESEFMDGCTNGKKGFVIDDMGSKLPQLTASRGGDPQLACLVRLLNNIPYFPAMASLEEKGMVCAKPLVVGITSNVATLGVEHSYCNPAIVHRRVRNFIHVKVRAEFADANGVLDSRKMMAWSKRHPGKVPNAWEFTIVVKTAAEDADGKLCTRETKLAPMDTPTLLNWCLADYTQWHEIQKSVLQQSNTLYQFDHIIQHGGAPDPSIDLTEDIPDEAASPIFGEIVSSELVSYPEEVKPEKKRRPGPRTPPGSPLGPAIGKKHHGWFKMQSGEEFNNPAIRPTFYRKMGDGFDDFASGVQRGVRNTLWWDCCVTPIALFCAFVGTSAYYGDWGWLRDLRAMANIVHSVFVTNSARYRAVMDWVQAGLDVVVRVAKAIAPFVAAVAVVGIAKYIVARAKVTKSDEYELQGGTMTKRKTPEPEDCVPMSDVLLLSTLHSSVAKNEYTEEPGARTIKSSIVIEPGFSKEVKPRMPNFGGLLSTTNVPLPERCPFYSVETLPDGRLKYDMTAPVNREWIPLANDARKSYVDSVPKYKDSKVADVLLTNASKSATGFDIPHAVSKNMVELVFSSAPFDDSGALSLLTGIPNMVRSNYIARGMFYQKNELVTSAHYIPFLNAERKDDPKWKSDWTMTIKGVGDKGSDVVMTHTELVGDRSKNIIKVRNKDMVKIRIPKARMFSNLIRYMVRRNIPEDAAKHPWVISASTPQMKEATLNAFESLPKNLPVSFLGRTGLSPSGYITDTTLNAVDDGKEHFGIWSLILARAYIPFETRPGDCGSPYISLQGDTYRAIVGMHTGAVRGNEGIKVITPLCQEDFTDCQFGITTVDVHVIDAPGTTLQDAMQYTMKFPDGPQFAEGIHIQYAPKVEKSPWTRRTEEWIKDDLGIEVNPDCYVALDKRVGAITGNLKSEYREAPTRALFAEEGITSNKVPPNLNRSDRNFAAAVNLSKMMTHPPFSQTVADEAMEAASCYLKSIVQFDQNLEITGHLGEIPMPMAINGRRTAEGNPEFRTFNSINMGTAAGLPYSELKPGNKTTWFIIDQEGNRSMGDDLQAGYDELRGLMANPPDDREVKVIFKVAIKDEVMTEAKLLAGEVRFILVCPVNATVLTRKLMLSLCRIMANNPFVFGACVGVDSTSAQWEQLFSFLTEHGQLTWDGDYKGFDKALILEITTAIRWVIIQMLIRSKMYDAEQIKICDNLLKALLSPIVDVFGLLYFFKSLNSSGNPLTTQFNCIANMILIWLAFLRRIKRNTGANFDLNRAFELFMAIIRALTYGDDNILSIDNGCGDIFNCRIMAEELAGIAIYTDAQKSTVATEFTTYDDLMFLGRKWTTSGCPLEIKRIYKMMTSYRRHHGLDYAQVIQPIYRSVLLEAYFHGRPFFDALFGKIVKVFSAHFDMPSDIVVGQFLSDANGPLTYDFFDEWYQAKALTEALEDPRFDHAKDNSNVAEAISWYRGAVLDIAA